MSAAYPLDHRNDWPAVPAMPALPVGWALGRMSALDLEAVAGIEARAYSHPWTRGNFENSVKSGHLGLTLRDPVGTLVAYAVLMPVVDEMHLLNITVEPQRQRQGLGRLMLAVVLATAHAHRIHTMLLEVRPSNTGAIALYQAAGFAEIGRRKGYYPALGSKREDALVLRRNWPAEAAANEGTEGRA
ncbi:ribosomal-protein-alanine acetyltransferase [Cupriavidus necator N-1]|uniref:[Ribosomal protein bS18]-alanine N-acetyltransferase n=1 Tax=Cupriavidus necator (strain ATCC 43291 / DSM 13513 / CCUG 52238 / LMG 8453 / N-1) TaxID=1042878 RepID=G0EYJ5_CUPNN|nr:ribosomal protein S18-alanine N-acetyltransferase [Cupriavidus necator]AEI77383.1 ribosomal-protein-alanine acetyltransferase [Cupriavidus necator N-1]KAI3597069.1 Ribosomal-protein-S18p-alanine acetyltransferase [Cupriavidus necator H850]MDX6014073.1 ribosomal protein S18-alanine N-acetyltransferase [Cupriavidus necator]